MKKVLVTGGAGFIGSHCLPLLLSAGYEVHVADLNVINTADSEIFWHEIDLLDDVQVNGLLNKIQPEYLLHLSWCTEHKRYWSSFDNFKWVESGLNLMRSFHLYGGKRMVVSGTCAEYDWGYGYCNEDATPLLPKTLYGICKHSYQSMLNIFSQESGLSSSWARVFFLYGPGENPKRLVPAVINSLLQDKEFHCQSGDQIRDFLYVEDVASAFVVILESDIEGAVNLGSGEPKSLKEVVSKIGEKLGRLNLIHFDQIGDLSQEPKLLAADISKLRKQVQWNPQYNLDQGLDKTIKWWQEFLKRDESCR